MGLEICTIDGRCALNDFECRSEMWETLSKLFSGYDPLEFAWMFSRDDLREANNALGIDDMSYVGIARSTAGEL